MLSDIVHFIHPRTAHSHALSLHDALPIYGDLEPRVSVEARAPALLQRRLRRTPAGTGGVEVVLLPPPAGGVVVEDPALDRKSTRLNSSHLVISYAVFCLKKKRLPRRSIWL